MPLNKNLLRAFWGTLLIVCVIEPVFSQSLVKNTAHRWVIRSNVDLRAAPNSKAELLTRLALHTQVSLIAPKLDTIYCEVELTTSGLATQRGFTACKFLGTSTLKPRGLTHKYLIDDQQVPNPNYNPERAFWLKPSYETLKDYGRHLENLRQKPRNEAEGVFLSPRPTMPKFERMKAHLAKGVLLTKPAPFVRWESVKASAWSLEIERLKLIKKFGSIDKMEFDELYGSSHETRSEYLQRITGIHTLDGEQGRMSVPPKLPAFVDSLELPTISSSYFQSHDEIAAPNSPFEVAARFQIVQTTKTRSFDALPKTSKENREWFGLWDVSEVSQSLTQPVFKNTLLREGGYIQSEATHLREKFLQHGDDYEGVMCEGHEDGFSFGDADPKISINYAKNGGHPDYAQPKKAGDKLMYFFTKKPLPQQTATLSVVKQKLNRAKTGFVAATEFHFDINSDGISDILVWEGTGIGPGHLDGPTKTDDAWYRIFFVNFAGHWHLLGTDTYSYGCGC